MSEQVTILEVVRFFETVAPGILQENYDNSGLQTGEPQMKVTSALVALDVTEEVVDEAIGLHSNLIVAHHPLIFGGIKRITGSTPTERILIKALRNQIAILAAHTNFDNIREGVNAKIAEKIGLLQCEILQPVRGRLRKLVTYVPAGYADIVREALFSAGAGHIGDYDQCSFNTEGNGTYRGSTETHPFKGVPGLPHTEPEVRIETILPNWLEHQVVTALLKAHPYEEVAYDIYPLENKHDRIGAGLAGILPQPMEEGFFLEHLKRTFGIPVIRHSPLLKKPVTKVALCGGAGSFLLKEAMASEAQFFITGDIKYHQFFEPAGKLVMADIGHFESEQFTSELFLELLIKKFPTFAVRLSKVKTNPVGYYL